MVLSEKWLQLLLDMPSLSKTYALFTIMVKLRNTTCTCTKVERLRWNEKLVKLVSIMPQIISFHNYTSRHSTNNRDNAPWANEKTNRHIYAIEANNIPVFGINIEDVFIVRHCIFVKTSFKQMQVTFLGNANSVVNFKSRLINIWKAFPLSISK